MKLLDYSGLQRFLNKIKTLLDSKSNTGHTHTVSDVSGLATVATSGDYGDLSNTPTIPTVNNATLTIQKNGTTVKTFTANASSNVTANITVPTKTSELTNDSHSTITMGTDSTSTASPAHGDTFTCIDSVTKDTNGHITAVNTKTVTLPADNSTDTLMTQNVSTTNATYPVLLVATADATANQGAKTGIFAKSVKVNPSTNVISASGFSGPLTGDVTGNCSGSSGSCTGNAATATQFSANKSVTLTGDVTGTASSKAGWSVATTLANSGVTAGTYGPSADVTGNNNATISVPEITVDAKGRVTSVTNRTLTCKNNTYNVYNKTLTIQKNGTNVATFTSNSNTDVTANITVPTKVSELTNDSGFLTSHQSLSNYVTLNSAQTISGIKTIIGGNQGKMVFKNPNYTKGDANESSVTISRIYFGNMASYDGANAVLSTDINTSGNSIVDLAVIDNTARSTARTSLILTYDKSATRKRLLKSWGDFVPYGDSTYDLGSSTLQWKKIYSADVVHTSGDETIGGAKVLTDTLSIVQNPSCIFMTNPDITLGTAPTETNRYYGDYYLDTNGDQVGYSVFQCNKNGNNCILWGVINTGGTNTYQSQIKFTVFPSGGNALFPSWSGCDLGLATNKWETFNGLNPGILSFPNINYTPSNPDSCDVSTALYNGLRASTKNPPQWRWTAPLSGWLTIVWYTKNLSSAPHRVIITAGSNVASTKFGQTFSTPAVWYFPTTIPVVRGVTYYFDISFKRTDSASEILSAYVVPCQGNV